MPLSQLQHLEGFVVERPGVGRIEWLEPVDLSYVDLDAVVCISEGSAGLYPPGEEAGASATPDAPDAPDAPYDEPGTKLNVPVRITIYGLFPGKATRGGGVASGDGDADYRAMLENNVHECGGTLEYYDPGEGTLCFTVQSF